MEDHRHDKKLAAPDRFPMAKRRDQDVEHLARAKMCSRTNHLGSRTDEGERLGGSRIVASFESCPLEKNYFSFLFFFYYRLNWNIGNFLDLEISWDCNNFEIVDADRSLEIIIWNSYILRIYILLSFVWEMKLGDEWIFVKIYR